MTNTIVAPVRKTLDVACAPDVAFHTFTEKIDTWWPRRDYSIGGDRVARIVFEPRAGGRIFEVLDDGSESDWGSVVLFDPPARVVFTWHPGSSPSTPTEVEVSFHATSSGTRVELEHRNWDRLGERAESARNGYDGGWNQVLAALGDVLSTRSPRETP